MSKIEWTEETWNPLVGCSPESDGCLNCYAATFAHRGMCEQHKGLTKRTSDGRIVFNGITRLVESQLLKPLKRKKPTVYFVCSMGDFHHPSVKQEWKDRVMAVAALCPQHTFIFLTKRAKEQREYISIGSGKCKPAGIRAEAELMGLDDPGPYPWPLPNVILGVSVENQEQADARIPDLLATPAAKRFVSYEPALGPVDWGKIDITDIAIRAISEVWAKEPCTGHDIGGPIPGEVFLNALTGEIRTDIGYNAWDYPALDCIIAGGETGPGARPSNPDWFRKTRDQCEEADVSFFFKGWGEWAPLLTGSHKGRKPYDLETGCVRIGKKASGRLLDGREHLETAWGLG